MTKELVDKSYKVLSCLQYIAEQNSKSISSISASFEAHLDSQVGEFKIKGALSKVIANLGDSNSKFSKVSKNGNIIINYSSEVGETHTTEASNLMEKFEIDFDVENSNELYLPSSPQTLLNVITL